nr:acetyltransferase [Vibrio cholerae]
MVTVVVFEFSVMRCQPLRRALCLRGWYLSVFIQSIILLALQ